jgi:hypothetical protein
MNMVCSTQVWTVSTVFVELSLIWYPCIPAHTFLKVFCLMGACVDLHVVSFCQTPDVSNSTLPFSPVASTFGQPGSQHSSQRLSHSTFTMMDRVEECSCRKIDSEFQGRSNIVDRCLILRLGSPPRRSQCVGQMDSDGTTFTHKFVGTQCSGKNSSPLQRQCQAETDSTEDRQLSSGVLHQSPGRNKICSPVHVDMEYSPLVSSMGCTTSRSTHSWGKGM